MKEINLFTAILIYLFVPMILLMFFYDSNFFISLNLTYLSVVIALLLVGKVNKKVVSTCFNDFKTKFNLKDIAKAVAILMLVEYGFRNLSYGVFATASPESILLYMNDFTSIPTNLLELTLMFTLTIIIPFMNQLLFTKILFSKLYKNFSFTTSAVISSIIYAAELSITECVRAIPTAILCCVLYIKYKNILIPIVVQVINNMLFFIYTAWYYYKDELTVITESLSKSDIYSFFISGSLLAIIGSITFIMFIKKNKRFLKDDEEIAIEH